MLVVPLEKDIITTEDDQVYTVIEYTSLKQEGPAVYCKSKGLQDPVLVYFFDIVKIGKTSVEYQKSSKVFNALGKVKRVIDLPQPDDKVTVDGKEYEVTSLKLKSKSLGRGLFVKDDGNEYHRAKDITNIDRALGGSDFDQELFLKIYHEYFDA